MHLDVVLALFDVLGAEKFVRNEQSLDCHLSQGNFHAFRTICHLIFTDSQRFKEAIEDLSLLSARHINDPLIDRRIAENLFQGVPVTSRAVTQNSLSNNIFQESALFVLRLGLDVVVKVFASETRWSDNHASDFRVGWVTIASKVSYERRYDVIVEFAFWWSVLLCRHGASWFGDSLLNRGFLDRLCLTDDEDVCEAFLHGDSDNLALLALLWHLIQLTDMHRVENWLHYRYWARRLDVHALLLVHGDVFVFSRIDAIDSKRVIFCIILERLNLQGCWESFCFHLCDTL